MSAPVSYMAVRDCAVVLLAGAVLTADDVTAGYGCVIDWRIMRSGQTVLDGADAFDTAMAFVRIVGPEAACRAAAAHYDPTDFIRRSFLSAVRFMRDSQ